MDGFAPHPRDPVDDGEYHATAKPAGAVLAAARARGGGEAKVDGWWLRLRRPGWLFVLPGRPSEYR